MPNKNAIPNQTDIPKVHLTTRQNLEKNATPLKACTTQPQTLTDNTKQMNEQRQTRTKKNTGESFQNMHKDLLQELRNINSNIFQIAESLKDVAISLKEK